jgi:hypothetical protein
MRGWPAKVAQWVTEAKPTIQPNVLTHNLCYASWVMSAALVPASRAGWRRGDALLRPESGSLLSVAGSDRPDDNE